MARRKPSLGTGTRLRAPAVTLREAEYGLFSLYSPAAFSLFCSVDNSASFFFSIALNTLLRLTIMVE
jgi:hypothetical protein